MKTKEEYLKILTDKLLPIGTRCIIKYPKCKEFYKQGAIIQHVYYCGTFYWDYLIKLDDGNLTAKDKSHIDEIL